MGIHMPCLFELASVPHHLEVDGEQREICFATSCFLFLPLPPIQWNKTGKLVILSISFGADILGSVVLFH